jgi:antitoxin CptB
LRRSKRSSSNPKNARSAGRERDARRAANPVETLYKTSTGDRMMTDAPLDLDARRRRIKVRAWRRGMREVDLILGGFADAHLATLSEPEIGEFERLLDATERDVFSWISGELEVPAEIDTPFFARVRAFHTHAAPLHG